jgi:hypothetical protein
MSDFSRSEKSKKKMIKTAKDAITVSNSRAEDSGVLSFDENESTQPATPRVSTTGGSALRRATRQQPPPSPSASASPRGPALAEDTSRGSSPSRERDIQNRSEGEESEEERTTVRPIRKRTRDLSPSTSSEDDNLDDPSFEDDNNFGNERSFMASASEGKSRRRLSLVVPSNISVNQKLALLKDTITPREAAMVYDQSRIPGCVNSIPSNHILIQKKAEYLVNIRINSREEDWGVLFPSLEKEEVPQWMDLLTVVQASELVYTLFGPEAAVQQKIDQKTLDVLLREIPFRINYNDEMVEDKTFSSINDLLENERLTNGELHSDRLCELSKIISARLPVDSQIASTYKMSYHNLTTRERKSDTPQRVIDRIKKILQTARREIRLASKWIGQGNEFSTDKKGCPVTQALQAHTTGKPPSGKASGKKKSQSDTSLVCDNCGWVGHEKTTCFRLGRPGTNGSTASWADSIAGKAWNLAGYDHFTPKTPIPPELLGQTPHSSSSSSSAGATSSTVNPSQRTPMSACKYAFMSSVYPSTFSTPSDFLTATVSLQSQTVRLAAEVANRTEVEAGAGAKKTVQALLDTGSLAGNFISQAIITDLMAENYVYRTKRSFSVCSGLDNVCYDSDKMINLLFTYNNERTQKLQSIFLRAFVAQNSPIDLIIGRSSIKKHHFHRSNPTHFMSSDIHLNSENTESILTNFPKAKPLERKESVTLHGMKNKPLPKTPISKETKKKIQKIPFLACALLLTKHRGLHQKESHLLR